MKAAHIATALAFGTLSLLPLTGAAMAAGAYASDKISIFYLPRNRANEIVGMLQAGEQVTIDRCTTNGTWCRVLHNGPTGWVPASYLVGAAAKIDATPLRSLASPPFDEQRDHTRQHGNLF